MRSLQSTVRSHLVKKLTPKRKAWASKLRHGEHSWQRVGTANRSVPAAKRANYDARAEQEAALDEVRGALSATDIDFVELPRLSIFNPVLVVRASEVTQLLSSVAANLPQARDGQVQIASHANEVWFVNFYDARGAKMSHRSAQRRSSSVTRVDCLRQVVAPNLRVLSTPDQTVSIELWQELGSNVQRADGGLHVRGTLRRRNSDHGLAVDYMEPTTWAGALRNNSRLALPAPHLRQLQQPVDIVYTWVDGSDPDWRAQMTKVRDKLGLGGTESSSVSDSRFTSREELRFSLRSLEYYASWVRRIFIVTDQQVPEWLNTDHPKITLVDHREIFSDTRTLPVFNSHAIESQLHHIPGLAEHYIYLNDDCFFLRPTDPELFFTANGLSKHFRSIVPIDIDQWTPRDLPIISAAKQGRDYLADKYGRTVTHRFKHTPHAQIRSVLETMESEEPELFARVASSPFRSPEDVSIPSSLHHFDAFARGRSIEGQIGYQFVDLNEDDLELRLLRVARRTDLDVFCLNETTLREESEEWVSRLVARFFNDRFPVPSSFENDSRSSRTLH